MNPALLVVPPDGPEPAGEAAALVRLFRALADPTRLAIIELLSAGPRNVTDLCEQLGAPQTNVSNHLACLRRCDLVKAQRTGREQVYDLADLALPGAIAQFAATIRQARKHLQSEVPEGEIV